MPVDAGFSPRASRLAAQAGDMDVEADTSTTRYLPIILISFVTVASKRRWADGHAVEK